MVLLCWAHTFFLGPKEINPDSRIKKNVLRLGLWGHSNLKPPFSHQSEVSSASRASLKLGEGGHSSSSNKDIKVIRMAKAAAKAAT